MLSAKVLQIDDDNLDHLMKPDCQRPLYTKKCDLYVKYLENVDILKLQKEFHSIDW